MSISFDQLESVFDRFPTLNRQVMGMMSREVSERHSHQVLMGRRSALERVALFLLRYSERLESRGFVGSSFSLSLSRQDLANYLGLQIETVSRTIGKLKEKGIGIVYISHFLEEVREVADEYAVLRDGHNVGTGKIEDVSDDQIISLMVGRDVDQLFPSVPHQPAEPWVEINGLRGSPYPQDVSVSLRRGEIFGVA